MNKKRSAVQFLGSWREFLRSPAASRLALSMYPPYLGAGIKVDHISDDFRVVEVSMGLGRRNRNYVGTQFGGSLYSMCDPFFMLQLMRILGPRYLVWDQAAEIRFVAPGRGRVHARFEITDDLLDDLYAAAAGGEKVLRWIDCEVRGEDGELVAEVRKQLYVRLKRDHRPAARAEVAAAV